MNCFMGEANATPFQQADNPADFNELSRRGQADAGCASFFSGKPVADMQNISTNSMH
jgi:hypothetical protein